MANEYTKTDCVDSPIDSVEIAIISTQDSSDSVDNNSDADRFRSVKEQYPQLTAVGRFAYDKKAASEAGKKGIVITNQIRRKRRLLKDAAQQILSADISKLPVPEMEDIRLALHVLGVEDITGADALMLAQYIRAAKGDTEAARFVRDTSGEKPSVSVDVNASDRPVDAEMLGAMSDAELAALADGQQDAPALPPKQPEMLQ